MRSEIASTAKRAFVARLTAALCAAWACVAGATAQAAHTLEVRDGDTAIARISLRDQTRIRVDRGRITDVLGDIYDANANPAGRVTLVRDETDGEVYVKPIAWGANPDMGGTAVPALSAAPVVGTATPVKLDIKTDRGTFALLLQPSDVVGDTLVLRPLGAAANANAFSRGAFGNQRGAAHERSIKALTLAMANPELASEAPPRLVAGAAGGGQEVALWREARFVLKSVQNAPGMVGETFELTNVSAQRMVVDERELYRDGVIAVSIKRLVLGPGESTPVWILRQPNERD